MAVRLGIVLQEGQVYCNRGSLAAEETVLQYSLVGSRFVLQYKLYCELGVGLCCNTAQAGAGHTQLGSATQPGARQGRGRLERAGGRVGHGRRARRDSERVGRGSGRGIRRAARALGARPRLAGWPRLCTRCTQPVFDPV